jgi:uncharacterized membrane protein YhhN
VNAPDSDVKDVYVIARPNRATVAAIVLFAVLSMLHLTALIADWDLVRSWTKPFLMPSLTVSVVLAGALRVGRTGALLIAALAFSTLGDVALLGDGSAYFIAGLSAFLLAHVAYVAIFCTAVGRGKPRWWSVVYLAWFGVLMVVLVPHLDGMLIPVVGYGLVIATMAIMSTRCAPLVALGATLFLLSDSLLAINRFVPDAHLWQPGLLVMLTYIAGQALIAWGLVASWADGRGLAPAEGEKLVRA